MMPTTNLLQTNEGETNKAESFFGVVSLIKMKIKKEFVST